MKKWLLIVMTPFITGSTVGDWGFFVHQRANRLAVFTLPQDMLGFYKHNIQYLTEHAVDPDRRRYAVKDEAPRHYIDLDTYGDSAYLTMPRYWKAAVEKYTEDTLKAHGTLPWSVDRVRHRLTHAFLKKDIKGILRLSADLGHYIGDANVPLHTTENYNGQLTGQVGIHGFWESRVPELFSGEYDFFIGRAEYLERPQLQVWAALIQAHQALDSVLTMEKALTEKFPDDKKYSFETRGAVTVRVYSRDFSKAYHQRLNGMVERQMRKTVKMIGDFWYTCWVDAGQPDLDDLIGYEWSKEDLEEREKEIESWKGAYGREHER